MQSTLAQTPPRGANRRQLLLAGGLALLAAVLVIVAIGDNGGGKSATPESTVQVIVAAQPIAAGDEIKDSMLATKALPVSAVPGDAFNDKTLVVGKTVRYPIEKGETVTNSRLVTPAKVRALSFQIPPGLRGMTLPVDIKNTPAALIAPGDFVDVIVSVELVTLTGRVAPTPVGGSHELKGAATILQNVQVLSVDRDYVSNGVVYDASVRGTPPGEKDSVAFVTLAVTPDQAQLLWLAQDQGKLTLVLRAFGDDSIVPLGTRSEPIQLP